jgi:hypothetical protein
MEENHFQMREKNKRKDNNMKKGREKERKYESSKEEAIET